MKLIYDIFPKNRRNLIYKKSRLLIYRNIKKFIIIISRGKAESFHQMKSD